MINGYSKKIQERIRVAGGSILSILILQILQIQKP